MLIKKIYRYCGLIIDESKDLLPKIQLALNVKCKSTDDNDDRECDERPIDAETSKCPKWNFPEPKMELLKEQKPAKRRERLFSVDFGMYKKNCFSSS